jgi:hypothetical protein
MRAVIEIGNTFVRGEILALQPARRRRAGDGSRISETGADIIYKIGVYQHCK